jgi:hypothetical protein
MTQAPPAPLQSPVIHCLKVWSEYFGALVSGKKTFEVRKDDRGFRAGDLLVLQEWDPARRAYTGEMISKEVLYVLPGGGFGIAPDHVVMSLATYPKTNSDGALDS